MFKVSILKESKSLFDGMAKKAVLPGMDGQLTILPFHCPLVVRLTLGAINIDDEKIDVTDGVVKFENNEMFAIVE